jgi:hypothetical protein
MDTHWSQEAAAARKAPRSKPCFAPGFHHPNPVRLSRKLHFAMIGNILFTQPPYKAAAGPSPARETPWRGAVTILTTSVEM